MQAKFRQSGLSVQGKHQIHILNANLNHGLSSRIVTVSLGNIIR